MFSDPDYQQIQNVLLRMVRDRRHWHDARYALRSSDLDTNVRDENVKLHKDAFAWYKTLEKNIVRYMRAVVKLETLEKEHLPFFGIESSDDALSPHKIKQLLIAKLIAEMGRSAGQLRSIIKHSDAANADNAVRLRRRIRWLEVKLDSLVMEPLMTLKIVQQYYTTVEGSDSLPQSPPSHFLVESPSFIISVADGETLSSEDSAESDTEDIPFVSRFQSHVDRKDVSEAEKAPDAVDEYWSSEHHQVDYSQLQGLTGLTYHALGVHRSDSYVKDKGSASRAALPWPNAGKDYIDPNSEEKALERLSITVQQMMGRAYTAAGESIPINPEDYRARQKAKADLDAKINNKRPTNVLAHIKGQKWMEKKFRRSIHSKDTMVYHPPPEPIPPKLLLAKLSDDIYPPTSSVDNDMLRNRAKDMPPRFVNQHDLLKKTHYELFELLFDANKVESKVDVRKATDLPRLSKKLAPTFAPSASITRGPIDQAGQRPNTPKAGKTTTKGDKMKLKKIRESQYGRSEDSNYLPPVSARSRSLVLPTQKDRVYMTKSGWVRTRRMPAPIHFITLRLERAKELVAVVKKESVSVEQRISSLKQLTSLGVTNADIISNLLGLISMSDQRSSDMDVRFEVVKLLLTLGFIEDSVLKELLVFISSTNHQVLCHLLRTLRKALSSPRIPKPFGKSDGLPDEMRSAPDLKGKALNLLYISAADCLLVHRLIQLAQCPSPELSFYAAACLRHVKVMPPPPPLPPTPPEKDDKDDTLSVSSNDEEQAVLAAQAEYSEKLEKYAKLLREIDEQATEISVLTEYTFRQIARSGAPITYEALHELLDGIGVTDDELFKIAYELLEKTAAAGIRAALIRMLGDALARLQASSPFGMEVRLNEFQEVLKSRLIVETDKKVCTECARAFFKLGLYDKVSEAAIKNLDNTLPMELKMQAIRCAVGLRIRGARLSRALVDLLELDSSDGVRIAACRALASVGTTDRRALAALREKYERTQGVVAKEAGKALGVLTANAAVVNTSSFNPAFLDALADRAMKTGAA